MDGETVGFVKLGPLVLPVDAAASAIELRQIYILDRFHGTGIARALMDWALDQARLRGAEEMYLTVYTDNHRAQRVYERYGFEVIGPYAFMVGEQADEDLIMRLRCERGGSNSAPKASRVPHGFLGRKGGASTGELAGLNVGYGSSDDREAIGENRRRAIAAVLPGAELATVHQVHSAEGAVRREAMAAGPSGPTPTRWSPTDRVCCSGSSPPIARRCCSPMPTPG